MTVAIPTLLTPRLTLRALRAEDLDAFAAMHALTPADAAAKSNRNAEVKAFFASGQVRPIRVHSEVTQRALRGHPEATQRPSEAIRGHSEALRGHPRALRDHPSETTLGNHS